MMYLTLFDKSRKEVTKYNDARGGDQRIKFGHVSKVIEVGNQSDMNKSAKKVRISLSTQSKL